jgi:arylsulfatase A-like enzyme
VYGGMVEAMDQAVGKVLSKLDELGLTKNTLVIFTSDNGGLSTSEGSPTSNLPLRGGKGWMYEGGIREPLIVRWPGVVKAGTEPATPATGVDYFPTLMEAANGKTDAKIDGVSLMPVLNGGDLPERPLYWHYPHYGNQGGAPGAAVRLGDWKLIEWYEDGGRSELFNVREDVGEKNDLASKHPDKVTQLAAMLAKWRADVGAVMPATNPKYDPAQPSGRMPAQPPNKKKKKG